jgi:hypothetical protein
MTRSDQLHPDGIWTCVGGSVFGQREYGFFVSQKKGIAVSTGKKAHLRIGLTLVGFKHERQSAVVDESDWRAFAIPVCALRVRR